MDILAALALFLFLTSFAEQKICFTSAANQLVCFSTPAILQDWHVKHRLFGGLSEA
jgi:hypothetical protein